MVLGVEVSGAYRVILSTDDTEFGGHNRVNNSCLHFTTPEGYAGRQNYIQAYLPSRVALVFAKQD